MSSKLLCNITGNFVLSYGQKNTLRFPGLNGLAQFPNFTTKHYAKWLIESVIYVWKKSHNISKTNSKANLSNLIVLTVRSDQQQRHRDIDATQPRVWAFRNLCSIKVLRHHYYDQSRTITRIQLTGLIGVGFSSARGYFLLDVKGRIVANPLCHLGTNIG